MAIFNSYVKLPEGTRLFIVFFWLFASYLAARYSYYGHLMYSCIILAGGLEHAFYFSINIGNVIIPTDFHIFQMGRYTTNQKS